MQRIIKNIIKDMNVDWNLFKKILFYNIGFFIAFILIMNIFAFIMSSAGSAISSMFGASDLSLIDAENLQVPVSKISVAMLTFVLVAVLFIAIQLYTFAFFENKIWNTVFGKKTTFRNTSKFLLMNILLLVIFTAAMSAIFLIISKFQGNLIKIGVAIFYLALLFCFYLMFISYWAFGKTHLALKSAKEAYNTGVKRLDLTIVPLIISLLVFIAVNLILTAFSWMPEIIVLILSAVTLAVYLAWFRLYITNALKSVKL